MEFVVPRLLRPTIGNLMVELEVGLLLFLERKLFFHQLASVPSESHTFIRVQYQVFDVSCQVPDITGFGEQAGLIVVDHIRDTANVESNDRSCAGQCFLRGLTERLLEGCHYKDVCSAVEHGKFFS